jgi:murein DD-endopeptidase MepM/ murein hydrolase activator NlpD
MSSCHPRIAALGAALLLTTTLATAGPQFQLPTANRALFEKGGEERFFVGTVGRTWESGTFGSVRSEGYQLHEGLDIRALQRDKRGEATDPVLASADGTVAYINRKAALSNFGIYLILQHQVDGLEVFTSYAHLKEVRADLQTGHTVKVGETLGIMGRTANTREGISKDRAHLHFEINLRINERFSEWHRKHQVGMRNDHGDWNGRNLLGLDPRAILLAQQAEGDRFNLVSFIQRQPELCRVQVRSTNFPWLHRHPELIVKNPAAEKDGIAGYELVLNFVGIPCRVIPRSAAEMRSRAPVQLIAVNPAEQARNPSGKLVSKRGDKWQLTSSGERLISLLTY